MDHRRGDDFRGGGGGQNGVVARIAFIQQRIGGAGSSLKRIHFTQHFAAASAGKQHVLAVKGEFDFTLVRQGLQHGGCLIAVQTEVAVIHGIQRAEVPVVDQQAGGGVGGDIVFDLREGDRGGGMLFAARVAGQQHANLAHAVAVTRRPAGAGVIAGELPVFLRKGKTLQGSRQQGRRTQPQPDSPEERAHINPCQQSVRGKL